MKRAVILHGTDGTPDLNWFPWLKQKLEAKGYQVWVPLLPENHTPNKQTYNDFLFNQEWDFADNLVIGHSSGAVSVLNLLEDERCPMIKAGVLVGAWSETKSTILEQEQFKDLFPEKGFNFERIKSQAPKLLYLHGDNDPYCPPEQAKRLAQQTGSDIIVIPNGHHLGTTRTPKFPELLEALETKLSI